MDIASTNRRESHAPLGTKLINSPVLRAFFAQFAAFALCLLFAIAGKHLLGKAVPFFVLIAFQSITSVGLASLLRVDWWWLVIEFFFPVAVVLALYVQLPPAASLLLFLLLFLVFGTTFRTRVPYYPSQSTLPAAIVELLPDETDIRFLDVGSGFGGLLFDLSNTRPNWQLAGIEISWLPWLFSNLKQRFLRHDNLEFAFGRYESLDFSKFNVVFSYLSPVVMTEIWSKVQNEMVPGTIFLSYEFMVPGVSPAAEILTAENAPMLYVWKI